MDLIQGMWMFVQMMLNGLHDPRSRLLGMVGSNNIGLKNANIRSQLKALPNNTG